MSTDNISRFPYGGGYRRSEPTEGAGVSDAAIAARRADYLRRLQRALVNAEIGLKHETNLIIAAIRASRAKEGA